MYEDITGIILLGGKSARMGENKALLKLGNDTVIERLVKLMCSLFKTVILISNNPEEYSFLNLPVYGDIFPNKGPLSGIHSGLVNSGSEKNFVISCDIPLIDAGIISFITDYPTEKPIVITKADGFIQQLAGIYKRELIPSIERNLIVDMSEISEKKDQMKRQCRIIKLLETVVAEIINIEEEYKNYKKGSFFNMNRPEEYEFIKQKLLLK
jgi:molybdopterin-guanine dinucleotide biosynthesis protein A